MFASTASTIERSIISRAAGTIPAATPVVQGVGLARDRFVAALSSPLGVALQLVCLAFAIYHSVTWFALTPKAMPLMIKGEPVPGIAIVGAHYVAWAVVSIAVLIGTGM